MIHEQVTFTILYTAALSGQIERLPRLLTRIVQARSAAPGPSLLVDLGASCSPDSWLCEATDGRGMLVAMDGMGYDAFHIGPRDSLYRAPAVVDQMRRVIGTPLAAGPWTATVQRAGAVIHLVNGAQLPTFSAPPNADLVIGLRYSERSAGQVELVMPERPPGRWLLIDGGFADGSPTLARLTLTVRPATPDAPAAELIDHTRLEIVEDLRPDPTMTSVIEFVQSEARAAQRKRGEA